MCLHNQNSNHYNNNNNNNSEERLMCHEELHLECPTEATSTTRIMTTFTSGARRVLRAPLAGQKTTNRRLSSRRIHPITIATVFMITIASQQLLHLHVDASASIVSARSSTNSQLRQQPQPHLQNQQQQRHQNSAIIAAATDQTIRQAFPHRPLSLAGLTFEGNQFKSIYEAIRAHPDLREFASLCESKGVREIVAMDNIALTVFAPIDKSLGDLLAKSKSRSINLIDLAKHHIAHGFVMPNDNMKYPFQFQSYAGLMSPLYLNTVGSQGQQQAVFVNNAKIVASYLIQIDQDSYQTLHLIDEPLEFAYVNRRAQLGAHQQAAGAAFANQQQARQLVGPGGASAQMAALVAGAKQFASVKRPLQLDDLISPHSDELHEQTKGAILEFSERFGDLIASEPQVDLHKTRSLVGSSKASSQWARANLLASREQLQLERLGSLLAAADLNSAALRGRLFMANESNSLNTYFLPVNSDELRQLLVGGASSLQELGAALQAHIVPDQVLFTRTMSLGQLHPTLFNRAPTNQQQPQQHQQQQQQQVSLGLAKALPAGLDTNTMDAEEQSRQLHSTPLLLQAKCEQTSEPQEEEEAPAQASFRFRNGLSQSEILLANIPISNGVLHLIRRPVLSQPTNLLDYINDNDHQLSNFVQALGSQTGPHTLTGGQNEIEPPPRRGQLLEINKFRELLARDSAMLATFSNEFVHSNRTLLAPSDEAFSRLRYDLRALIFNDELMIPTHWDVSYRQDLLKRLIERHIIPDQTITSDVVLRQRPLVRSVASQNGQMLSFRMPSEQGSATDQTIEVSCGPSSGRLIHQDLAGTNGVLHVIDRVLGEEQETVHSLLTSLVIGYTVKAQQQPQQQQETAASVFGPMEELRELIEQNVRQAVVNAQPEVENPSNSMQQLEQRPQERPDSKRQSPELGAISKTIGQYLEGLSQQRRSLLGSSVNISFQLAKLVSRAEGADDWNEKFQRPERHFTYFVPNDLAWLRLQQRQPELYKPLIYFLDQQQQHHHQQANGNQQPTGEQQQALVVAGQSSIVAPGPLPRSSESSHRLLQILERHLIGNRKLDTAELNQLASLQTVGATLRLVESQSQPEHGTATPAAGQSGGASAFAALHSIIGGGHSSEPSIPAGGQSASAAIKKAIEFGSTQANILQAHETSNGFVYLIDSVLILPEDPDYIVQTSSTPAISSTMSSLLGGHNSAILDIIHSLFASTTNQMSTNSMIALIGTLTVAIVALTLVALVLIVRRYRKSKSLNRHQQLESGLTSSSSANSGSTSTTKSL